METVELERADIFLISSFFFNDNDGGIEQDCQKENEGDNFHKSEKLSWESNTVESSEPKG